MCFLLFVLFKFNAQLSKFPILAAENKHFADEEAYFVVVISLAITNSGQLFVAFS